MKKLTAFILCCGMIASLSACGNETVSDTKINGQKTLHAQLSVENNMPESVLETSQNDTSAVSSEIASTPSKDVDTLSPKINKESQTSSRQITQIPPPPDFNADEYIKLGEKLLQELKNKTASKITVLDDHDITSFMGFKPLGQLLDEASLSDLTGKPSSEITDKKAMSDLKAFLKLDQWQIMLMNNICSMPKTFLYFDHDLHINLEAQLNESWMSINSPSGHVTYIVPDEVYNVLAEKYDPYRMDLTSKFAFDSSFDMKFTVKTGKIPYDKKLSGEEKQTVLSLLSRNLFNWADSDWQIKTNFKTAYYQLALKKGTKTYLLNLCGIEAKEGYISVFDGKEYQYFRMPESNYNELLKIK